MSIAEHAINMVHGAREAAKEAANKTPSPEAIRDAALETVRGAYSAIRGSGSISTELKNTAKAYIDLPAGAVSNGLKACTELLTLQPINATCSVAKGLIGVCQDLGKIAVSPAAIGIAATQTGLNLVGNTAKGIVNSPIKAYRVAERGANQLLDLLGPTSVASSPGNDNNTPAPPAATASATQKAA